MKFIFILLFSPSVLFSQLTFRAGPSTFLGDLGGNRGIGMTFLKDFNLKSTGYEFGAGYKFNNFFIDVNYVYLHDADTLAINRNGGEWWRWIRKYWFRDNVFECSQTYQITFKQRFFIRSGIGEMYYNIKHDTSTYLANIIEKRYSLAQFIIPIIVGVHINDNLNLQISYRKTFTDYLDNVSLRGDPTQNDAYFTFNAIFILNNNRLNKTSRRQISQTKCPYFY